jgi:antitoxin (DNA-binding transcriptional repressor) of toxin-antitoxin stability system
MKVVSVRKLKVQLREYLRAVVRGDIVLVSEQGEVIAELRSPGQRCDDGGVPPGLKALASRGLVTLGEQPQERSNFYRRLPRRRPGGSGGIDILDEQRGLR